MCALDVRSEFAYPLTHYPKTSVVEANSSFPALSVYNTYKISHRQESESAWIFFIHDKSTQKHMVAKVLRPYSDLRYNLSNVTERQRCQLEAFHHNRLFTPEVYIGLAKLYNEPSNDDYILLGAIIEQPSPEALEQNAEYALIMEQLADDRRLDQLLVGDENSVQYLLDTLTRHIADLQEFQAPTITELERAQWGSYSALQRKLEENLTFLSLIRNEQNSTLNENIDHLSAGLREIFTEEHYADYLEERVQKGAIKHCHGDIKSLNIWMVPGEHSQLSVKLLDAIDFNPLFNNIDILSDFAMIAIDVWARTQSVTFACRMIDYYLELTNQDNPHTRMIFEYYLT